MNDEHNGWRRRLRAACVAALVAFAAPAFAKSSAFAPPATFAQLEAEGAVIGAIRIDARDIFDVDDPRESNALFRLVNRLHVRTSEDVIRRLLLFKTGERVSARAIDETERLMRGNRFLYDVTIRPASVHDGIVDIEVVTRDTWTLDLTGRFGRSGGANSTAFGVLDYNVLGTGTRLGVSRVSDVDRRGTQVLAAYPQALDGWTAIDLLRGRYSDGARSSASVVRPFYSLDTRWAAGASWDLWNRVDSIYNAGDAVAKYRHRSDIAEAFAGWSPGLVRGWTQRFSAGVAMHDDTYGPLAGEAAPQPAPIDHDMRGFFLRHEVIEDRFVKLRNRDQIARPEFFEMGFTSRIQVTRAAPGLGASRPAWLYSVSLSRGFSLPRDQDVLASATLQRQLGSTGVPLTGAGAQLRYFAPQNAHSAFYGSLSGDRIGARAIAPDQLLLGGDNGLRGYPLRYQSGDRRALVTLEERVYTDWYPFRLARVGAAVFYDRGRAWSGVNQNAVNGGWLSDFGVGLRIALDRAAFGNVLHADVAVPAQRTPGIKAVQFLVKTQITF
jgi:hypothetical protein